MKKEDVFSPIHDENIRKNLTTSPIWKECHHQDELDELTGMWLYTINFSGLTPIQVLNVQQY